MLKQPSNTQNCVPLTYKTKISQLTNQSAHLWLWRWCLFHPTLIMVGNVITDISAWLRNRWWLGSWLLSYLLRYTRPVGRKQDRTIDLSTFTLLNLLEVLPECRFIWSFNGRATTPTQLGLWNTENIPSNFYLVINQTNWHNICLSSPWLSFIQFFFFIVAPLVLIVSLICNSNTQWLNCASSSALATTNN